ncbi:GspE/PulE family protein [Spartinivicinus poritis]|uniref:GspE/PulE family protein n=1 Tax=Spartinivicinus poritis TaxID=2994640 RepID=A0ABT5U4Q5_9GAMM|nr:GspE/PulE family protein [Spartinivicinus sp. A2-2]MDE1461349.1 GspE/PulE family protein [Spartinivicinus sp. A2-2]
MPGHNTTNLSVQPLPEPIKSSSLLLKRLEAASTPVSYRLDILLIVFGFLSQEARHENIKYLNKLNADSDIGHYLISKNIITEREFQRVLAYKLGMPFVSLIDLEFDLNIINLLPEEVARDHTVLPVLDLGEKLVIAMTLPLKSQTIKYLSFLTNFVIEPVIAERKDIEFAIARLYGTSSELEALEEFKSNYHEGNKLTSKDNLLLGQKKPIVKLVHNMILDAIGSKASDIHLRPCENGIDLLFRIDGSLIKIRTFTKGLLAPIISRLKVMSGMDLAAHHLPQDGQAYLKKGDRQIDLRFSVIPTIYGESAVIRILDAKYGMKNLSGIGFSEKDLTLFTNLLHRSNGIILVTGPTGSGKSTTLYAALQEIKMRNVNVVTVEDPVEYHIDGLVQIQVNHSIGYTFSRALRHILRHDPDVLMVGEIRDLETAQMAIECSLTGHIVLSTLHTNSAATTIARLLEIGIDPYLVNTSLLGVLAQRLVRCNCKHCLVEEKVRAGVHSSLGLKDEETFYRGKGCDHCRNTGYSGRHAVYELLIMSNEIRQATINGSGAELIKNAAIKEGMTPLTQQALSLARNKLTSLEEVYRTILD